MMVLGRIISGFGVGLLSMIVPIVSQVLDITDPNANIRKYQRYTDYYRKPFMLIIPQSVKFHQACHSHIQRHITHVHVADHRGKLACIEFTGNITGYACSVVSRSESPTSNASH